MALKVTPSHLASSPLRSGAVPAQGSRLESSDLAVMAWRSAHDCSPRSCHYKPLLFFLSSQSARQSAGGGNRYLAVGDGAHENCLQLLKALERGRFQARRWAAGWLRQVGADERQCALHRAHKAALGLPFRPEYLHPGPMQPRMIPYASSTLMLAVAALRTM